MAILMQDDELVSLQPTPPKTRIAKIPTILIFDSGVGALSIYDEVRKKLLDANYLYVFDNEGFPYGEKASQFVLHRIDTIVGAMWKLYTVDLVIIACNTASTISLPALRKRFPCPIVGVVPAIKPAVKLTRNRIVGLLATRATIEHCYTKNLIRQFSSNCHILQLSSGELVNMAEAKLHGESLSLRVLRKILNPWLRIPIPPDTIVLGCTHFSLLNQELEAVLPAGTLLVDSKVAVARRVAWLIGYQVDVKNAFKSKTSRNRAYYLTAKPHMEDLIPALRRYGFQSLIKLSL